MAVFWRARRLNKLDFPALVWPMIATIGRDFIYSSVALLTFVVKNAIIKN